MRGGEDSAVAQEDAPVTRRSRVPAGVASQKAEIRETDTGMAFCGSLLEVGRRSSLLRLFVGEALAWFRRSGMEQRARERERHDRIKLTDCYSF
jgi:hypothetical protein